MWRQASLKARKKLSNNQIKSVPARGECWDAWEAPSAKQHRRVFLLKRGHAASNNKTDICLSIFPDPRTFSSQKSVLSGTLENIADLNEGLAMRAMASPRRACEQSIESE
jgi:hypothetical protein